MMHPLYGTQPVGCLPVAYPHDPILDDLSRQMALSQPSRRLSRGSNGQRPGNAMRVVKPSSANNSPRSSLIAARRKTLMNDGTAQRRQQQALQQASLYYGTDLNQAPKRSQRPVSWHPSSYCQQLQFQPQQTSYPLSTPNMYADQQDLYTGYPHFSPMQASYSCNTSPASAFSPLNLPFQNAESLQYLSPPTRMLPQEQSPMYTAAAPNQYMTENLLVQDDGLDNAPCNGWDWNTFVMHGFNTTTPPTPETYPQNEMPQPAMSETALSFDALDEPEEEGEILVGMGLYDTPDKYEEDPQLNKYRSTVSSLLGSTFRNPEPMGKGLKLEETWEPPKSDEDEDDEGDEESEEEDESEE